MYSILKLKLEKNVEVYYVFKMYPVVFLGIHVIIGYWIFLIVGKMSHTNERQ